MTPADTDVASAQAERLRQAWKAPTGWRHLSAVNNAFVGVWYMTGAFAFLLFGGLLALLMRTQLAFPGNDLVTPGLYNQLFTLHGSVMMFLFAIPMFEAFSILLLPQMVASRDLPFPRLSAYSFYCFILGGIFVCGSIFFDAAPAGGWFMYPPLTTVVQTGIGADIWLLGLSFIEIASIAAAVELIVGVLKCRAPGMALHLMPLYCWYILVVGGMIVLAFPPLILGDILLEAERAFDWPFFDAERGGDPLLWQHLFWIFGHPEVCIIFLPAVALMAMIVPTFAGRPIVGYRWIVLSAVGVGFLSFGLWVHHMFSTGLPGMSLGFFSAASEVIAIPTGIQIFVLLATVMAGRVNLSVPMLYAAGALAIFVLGGLTGVMIAIVPFDWQAHDSYFIVAHLHYTLIGGMLFPIVGGVYYYFPLIKGKHLSPGLGRAAFWLLFAGFNIAFLPMHASGLLGMPRRVYTYQSADGLDTLNLVSTIGAYIIAAGIVLVSWDLLRPKGKEPYAERNPWNAGTLEWAQEMPAELWGIRTVPRIGTRYPLWHQDNLLRDIDGGAFYLADAQEGRRETIVTTPVEAEPQQCLRLPGPTWKTLVAAVLTGAAFLFATWHQWWPALAASVLALGAILAWLWTGTAEIPEAEHKHVGLGVSLPLYAAGSRSVGWWAMFITMIADLTGFASLVFGYFYYWTIHDTFPPPAAAGPGLTWPLIGGAAITIAWLLTCAGRTHNRRNRPAVFHAVMCLAAVAAIGGAAALLLGPYRHGMDPTAHVYPAIVWLMVIWCAAHVFLGVIMQLYCVARRIAGRMTARHDIDLCNSTLYWHFVLATVAISVAILAFFPVLS
jgi:cytochrome c oxidase subunit I+III